MSTNFETAINLEEYWLTQDCLHPINYDVYISLGTRYYCAAGCKVCYIDKNFKAIKPNVSNYFPKITKEIESIWQDVFAYFYVVRTNDDLLYLKLNQPAAYDWYKNNASKIEYCFTDNAIFRTAHLISDIKFKAIANITISSLFAERVNQQKLMHALNKIQDHSPILKLKFVDCGNSSALEPYIKIAQQQGLNNIVHHNFKSERKVLEHEWADEQTTWVDSDEQGLMQIYREAVHIYFDRFYYSSDDASNVDEEPFHTITDKFDKEAFLADLIQGKQKAYTKWITRTKNEKFQRYFALTNNYVVNKDYNFIPGILMAPYSTFLYKMLQEGWTKTKYGLLKGNPTKIVSILGKKNEL